MSKKIIPWAGALPELASNMTLRDYFAASALQGIANLPSVGPGKWHQWAGEWAAWSYSVADAMLAERNKNKAQP